MRRKVTTFIRHRIVGLSIAAIALAAATTPGALAGDDSGFKEIFDGRTLEGWDGNPGFWRVEGGAITGQTTAENPTQGNTFLIWRGIERSALWQQAQENLRRMFPNGNPLIDPVMGVTGDFELKLEYRIFGGNSGIQYRSREVPDRKWVIGGYQADFEAGDKYSGILYDERGRGILALRGQKTVIGDDHKPTVVDTLGDTNELQSRIRKEDWNEYHIIARGNRLIHKINGHVTADVTDEDGQKQRSEGLLALQLHAGPPMKVQFRNIRLKQFASTASPGPSVAAGSVPASVLLAADSRSEPKRIAFVAGPASHGYGTHEHKAGCMLLAEALNENVPGVVARVYTNGWPAESSVLEEADAIVIYADGGPRHPLMTQLDEVDRLMKKGIGLVCIHYAVEIPKGLPGDRLLEWTGGYFESNWSVNPHWTAKYESLPAHEITRGVPPFTIHDEWYYHMRFPEEMTSVTPILTAVPPAETLSRPDGPHSGNPHVRAEIGRPQHMAWSHERSDGGRGFGFTGGHFHWNWAHDDFRKLMLNAIVWAAHGNVPESGVPSQTPSFDDLAANMDKDPPSDFNRPRVEKLLEEFRGQTSDRK